MDPPPTSTSSSITTKKRPKTNPRTVLSREQYQEELEQIIQRDYFPSGAPISLQPSSSLSQFHATTISAEAAAWEERQREAMAQKRRYHEQRLVLLPTRSAHDSNPPPAGAVGLEQSMPPPSTELRNALFFVPPDRVLNNDDSNHLRRDDDTDQRKLLHDSETEIGRMAPPATRVPTVVATATRFPSYNNNNNNNVTAALEQHHWEGSSSDEDEEYSVATTNLDAESVDFSLPTEIRLGKLRKQQQKLQPSSTAVLTMEAARMIPYTLPPESARDIYARPKALTTAAAATATTILTQTRPTNRLQKQKQQQQQRYPTTSPQKPSVRSGDSLGLALRAAYQHSVQRQAKKQRTRDSRSSTTK